MYKRALSLLVTGSFLFMASFLCVKSIDRIQVCSEPVQMLKLELEQLEEKAKAMEERAILEARQDPGNPEKGLGILDIAVSGQRVVDYGMIEHTLAYDLPDEELDALLRIVEAEAGNEDEDGKLLVANVVLNRMDSELFPDTVTGVVLQKEKGISQFSPVANGSFYREDISQGALYFAARKYADSGKMKWFDENLTYLFVHGGHEFFR